eukprot:585122-Amphidinium_carterae.1
MLTGYKVPSALDPTITGCKTGSSNLSRVALEIGLESRAGRLEEMENTSSIESQARATRSEIGNIHRGLLEEHLLPCLSRYVWMTSQLKSSKPKICGALVSMLCHPIQACKAEGNKSSRACSNVFMFCVHYCVSVSVICLSCYDSSEGESKNLLWGSKMKRR